MSTPAPGAGRPLSPHLQVYRPQMTSVTSILHRLTGAGLALGAFMAVWWLFSVVQGLDAYKAFYRFAVSIPGRALLFCWLWALCYHLLNGLRHLFWDAGKGIDMKSASRGGWAVIAGSVLLSAFFWLFKFA